MTIGSTPRQGNLLTGSAAICEGRVKEDSIWAVLHREGHRLFPDEMFADLFSDRGRQSVPPSIVATVMVLQRIFGLSDREAVEAFQFDARWKYAAGGLDFDFPGFAHTVLVDMRARLANSKQPRRIFDATLAAAASAGLVGAKRVLDSTPLYDAVATMDTITLIRSAIRSLLGVVDDVQGDDLRAVMTSGDNYLTTAKPQIDWDDEASREALIDSRAKDAYRCLALLDGKTLNVEAAQAGELLATVVGQDIEQVDGIFRIIRKVARDRVISTVDPDARHGHKTSSRGFDGYKGHVAIDPDTEIITDTVVTPGNAGDASVGEVLLDDLLNLPDHQSSTPESAEANKPEVYGDAAYGSGELVTCLEGAGIQVMCKTQPPCAPGGLFTKDSFDINLENETVTCPNGVTVRFARGRSSRSMAYFKDACKTCWLASRCTTASGGRTINIGPYEEVLTRARARQSSPEWIAAYRATRPKVERKLGHLMRRRHGGRRARVRGTVKVAADFNLLAASVNLARLAVLGAHSDDAGRWVVLHNTG